MNNVVQDKIMAAYRVALIRLMIYLRVMHRLQISDNVEAALLTILIVQKMLSVKMSNFSQMQSKNAKQQIALHL